MVYSSEQDQEASVTARYSLVEGLGDRIREAVKLVGMAEASSATGKSVRMIERYVAGTEPPFGVIFALAKVSGCSLSWLATGSGTMLQAGTGSSLTSAAEFPMEVLSELVLVRRLEVEASAGGGMVAMDEQDDLDFVAFKANWLRARNINPEFVRLISARGDSMEPTIRNGDLLLVDTSIDRVRDNSLYVIIFDGLVFVKRIHKRMTGTVILISDNERYPAEEIPAHETPNLHVAGRVVWYGRDI